MMTIAATFARLARFVNGSNECGVSDEHPDRRMVTA
jgi:hypothetical protein